MRALHNLPVVGGHTRIHGPADVHVQRDRPIANENDLLDFHAERLAKFRKPKQWRLSETVPAFISANRWIVLCPHCRGGISCLPDWDAACCFECGAVLDAISFPENYADIEATLLERPGLYNRNYMIGETLRDLVRDNLEHGFPPGDSDRARHIASQIRQRLLTVDES
jgi:hypothetical protein